MLLYAKQNTIGGREIRQIRPIGLIGDRRGWEAGGLQDAELQDGRSLQDSVYIKQEDSLGLSSCRGPTWA